MSSSSPCFVAVKNSSRQGHSRESSISTSSSLSSSSTLQAPTSPTCLPPYDNETFELPDQIELETSKNFKKFEGNGVLNHKEDFESKVDFNQPNELYLDEEDMASKHFDIIRKPLMRAVRKPVQTNQSGNKNPVSTDKSAGTKPVGSDQSETKILGLMDPHLSSVDDDFSDDFRTRLGSNLSEISMEDMDIVVQHEHIKTRRIMRKKPKPQRSEREEQEERKYPSPDDHKDENDEQDEEKEKEKEGKGCMRSVMRVDSLCTDCVTVVSYSWESRNYVL